MKKAILASLIVTLLVACAQFTVLANDPGTDGSTVTKVVTVSNLNVRSGPGQNYAAIGHLNKGDMVMEYSNNASWSTISFGGGVGYVYTPYIQVKSTTPPPGRQVETTMYVSCSMTNVRAGATTEAAIIGHMTYGEPVSVLAGGSANPNWYEVHYYSGVGYISKSNLMSNAPGAVVTAPQPVNASVYQVVCPSHVNVRSGPGTNYAVLGTYKNGDMISIYGINGGWGSTPLANDRTGYIYSGYLRKAQ